MKTLIEIFLALPLFLFFVAAVAFFLGARKESNFLARRLIRFAGWGCLVGGVLYDLGHLVPSRPLEESLIRAGAVCVGLGLGYFLSGLTVRRAQKTS